MFSLDMTAPLALAAMIAGAGVGFALGRILPENYRGSPTERVVQNAVRMISLLSLLVLGLLVASAKGKFDASESQSVRFAANLSQLNSELVNYGPGAEDTRLLLQKFAVAEIAETWRLADGPKSEPGDPSIRELIELMQQKILMLTPQSEYQRAMAKGAAETLSEIDGQRRLRSALTAAHSPPAFAWVLMAWITILFVAFGLYAPFNLMTVSVLAICALSMAGAIGLIVDLDKPFRGIVTVSPEPMLHALAEITAPPLKRAR